MSELTDSRTASEAEAPFNLTIEQAKAWIMYAFDGPHGTDGLRQYVKEIKYSGENKNETYSFWVKTNVDESYYTVDPDDGMIQKK